MSILVAVRDASGAAAIQGSFLSFCLVIFLNKTNLFLFMSGGWSRRRLGRARTTVMVRFFTHSKEREIENQIVSHRNFH